MPLSPTRRSLMLGAGALSLLASPAIAQSLLRLKMVLNWRYQGPQGWFFLADDRGYFREAGLAITMDQGNGSGAAVGVVASGSYDLGFGDINALIQLVARGPAGGATPMAISSTTLKSCKSGKSRAITAMPPFTSNDTSPGRSQYSRAIPCTCPIRYTTTEISTVNTDDVAKVDSSSVSVEHRAALRKIKNTPSSRFH